MCQSDWCAGAMDRGGEDSTFLKSDTDIDRSYRVRRQS
jgi:hypothetical protein